ncbi:MAG: alpha/beta hydrolase-fold protein, partial [Polyangiaceae bacterium]
MRVAALVVCGLNGLASCRGAGPAADAALPAASSPPGEPVASIAPAAAASTIAPASAGSAASPAPPVAPPRLEGFFESLPVAGHPDAFVSLPTGATGKRPVVVVIHGAGDRPDWQCGGWRRATGERAFVVCPTGRFDPGSSTRTDRRYTHTGGPALLAYIDASLEALAARYPDYADTSAPLLAGFSLGSYAILAIAIQHPDRFPRIALVEGATRQLDDGRARAFVKGGGLRVLFGCGQPGCAAEAMVAAARLSRDGLP